MGPVSPAQQRIAKSSDLATGWPQERVCTLCSWQAHLQLSNILWHHAAKLRAGKCTSRNINHRRDETDIAHTFNWFIYMCEKCTCTAQFDSCTVLACSCNQWARLLSKDDIGIKRKMYQGSIHDIHIKGALLFGCHMIQSYCMCIRIWWQRFK